MILDSRAHYTNNCYKKPVCYLAQLWISEHFAWRFFP